MKKVLVSLLLVVTLFSLTGCGKDEPKKENVKNIVISDEGFGTTTLSYSNDLDYEVKEETGGKYKEYTIKSVKENFELQLYHTDIYENGYNANKDIRSKVQGYKEYKWGNLEGYSYGASKDSIKFNIVLKVEEGKYKLLFGSMESIDYNNANIPETFESDNVQKLLNSIKFSE